MRLSPQGVVAERMWMEIADRTPGVIIDAVIVMPDHLHGILMTGIDPDIETNASIEEVVHDYKIRFRAAYRHHVASGEWRPYASKVWQRSFYDRIIRSESELDAIREYIHANPGRWHECENA